MQKIENDEPMIRYGCCSLCAKEVNQLRNVIIKRRWNKEPNSGELIRFYRYASIKQVIG